MAYGVVVVGVTHKEGYKVAAATRAEKTRHEHNKNHKKKCRDGGNTDSKLDVELIPPALEVTDLVGREVRELEKDLKHAHKTRVLPIIIISSSVQRRVGIPDHDRPPTRNGRYHILSHPR
jgi:hypothetical protein